MAVQASWAGSLRSALPVGGRLPAELWDRRHLGILALLWVHVATMPVFGIVRGMRPLHALVETGIVAAAAGLASVSSLSRAVRTGAASVGLLSSSAILVHFSGGVIEMHFHFFVMVAVVALYQDWLPFLAAIAYVFVHHGLMGAIDANSVYNHYAARNNPWKWAAVHAVFILGMSAVCLLTWRLNERAVAAQREVEGRLRVESNVVERLYEVGRVLAAELDTARVVQVVTDAATELTGAQFGAFFYNDEDESGRKYQLFTLSGAPREAFEQFGLPRATPLFGPTFEGLDTVRLDDVRADPRYGQWGPHAGMPVGHLPVTSYLAVPVKSRDGDVLGGLFFGHPEPGRFDEVAERIARGIASQAAIALDNARLYARQRTVAETLQHSLLPDRLPDIPGIAAAARYTAGGPDVEIGGDWYDVIALPGGKLVVAMGDVVGRGERAAALMGQLRAGVRAYAFDGKGPAAILGALNGLLTDAAPEHMATAVVAVLDFERSEMTVANAGHLAPIVASGNRADLLDARSGVPIGALPGVLYHETTVRFEPGSTLVFYTDGLVERRGESIDAGIRRLLVAATRLSGDPERLCDEVMRQVGTDRQDDAAVLVLRIVPFGRSVSVELPSSPGSLATVRATLRRWFGELGVAREDAYELLVVAGELASNAIRHAGARSTAFRLEAQADGDAISMQVSDSGSWRAAEERVVGGRGLGIVEAFSDEMHIDKAPEGTTVRVARRAATDRVPQGVA